MKYITSSCISLDTIMEKHGEKGALQKVAERYPFRLSHSYAHLIRQRGDAIWRQCLPDLRELGDDGQQPDPLSEQALSPVPGLIHRYPDRCVMVVSNRCPVYCRFCMRKRQVGLGCQPFDRTSLKRMIAYISSQPGIRDVILSGGDPLMLEDSSLYEILQALRGIPHVSIIRIGTRTPVTLPERVTPDLCRMLKEFHPLYVNTHFNHPDEITPASAEASHMLADAGIPLGNQTVLLRGVNDSLPIMRELVRGLLQIRVKPYYLHQMDLVRGTAHFRTSIAEGVALVKGLRGHLSGLAVPHYVIDLPGGKGKVAVLPETMERDGDVVTLTTHRGERVRYLDIRAPRE